MQLVSPQKFSRELNPWLLIRESNQITTNADLKYFKLPVVNLFFRSRALRQQLHLEPFWDESNKSFFAKSNGAIIKGQILRNDLVLN